MTTAEELEDQLQRLKRESDALREDNDRLRAAHDRLRDERDRLREELEADRLVPSDAPSGGMVVRLSVVTSEGWAHTALEALPGHEARPGGTRADRIERAAHQLGNRLARRYADEQDEEGETTQTPSGTSD